MVKLFLFCASFLPYQYEKDPDGHLNPDIKNEGFSRSLDLSFTTFTLIIFTSLGCHLFELKVFKKNCTKAVFWYHIVKNL